MEEIVKNLGFVVSGGGLAVLLNFLLKTKENKTNSFKVLEESWQNELERMNGVINKLTERVDKALEGEAEANRKYSEVLGQYNLILGKYEALEIEVNDLKEKYENS